MGNTAQLANLGGAYAAGGISNFKNRIINGDMRIDQRNAGASVTLTSYCVDRWNGNTTGVGLVSVQRVTDAPAGFSNSVKLTVSTADTSVTADDYCQFLQTIEGLNCADLGFGTASAQSVTVSFWVKSNITGTYCVGLRNSAANRSNVANYTINQANTWEYKTITFAGDTSGTWATDNTIGIYVTFATYQGPSSQGTANTWVASNARATSSISNTWPATVGNTWQLTGVQLEKGSTATSFDYRPYGTELALCQRYYEKSYSQGVAPANGALADIRQGPTNVYNSSSGETGVYKFAVTKRTSPTMTFYNPSGTNATAGQWSIYNGGWQGANITSSALYDSYFTVGFTGLTSVSNYATYITSGGWAASAEL